MIEKIDRIVVAVNNLDESLKFFAELLGIEIDVVGTNEEVGIRGAYSPCGLELIEPISPETIPGKFLQKFGEGIWGIVFKVKDMDVAKKHFEEKGLRTIKDIMAGKMREVSFHPGIVPYKCCIRGPLQQHSM